MKNEITDSLEDKLTQLAFQWRGKHRQQDFEAAKKIVDEYHTTIAELWELGWRGEALLPDSELPSQMMPKYFLDHGKE